MKLSHHDDVGITDKKSSVELEEVGQNPDGTFTYLIKGSQEELDDLMSAFFTQAILKGIEAVKKENGQFLQLKKVAADLERFLRVWEECGDLDYDPNVKEKREALTKLLYGKNNA